MGISRKSFDAQQCAHREYPRGGLIPKKIFELFLLDSDRTRQDEHAYISFLWESIFS